MSFEAQRQQFATEGYAVFDRALQGPALDLLRAECQRFVAREDARLDALGVEVDGITHRGRRYFAGECQRERPALRTVLYGSVMADICRATLGPDAYFFYDQFVVKGPDNGMAFSWHQDSGYMAHNGGPPDHLPYLTCWCPLDDATVENGTVRLLPFSKVPESRDAILPHERDPASRDLVATWNGPDDGVVVEVPAGSVVAFSSRLLHATGGNRTPKLRRVYLMQYSALPILDPGVGHLRRNAVPLVRDGRQVTLG
ncbi:phytanoyl-CoA dioxygenase family protein [Azospirillum sp. B4]|uniref:phytanoyl-CoA dioxygenase family protein n=1 Tax=Azospirillum sp. B4 TaxID=95605 RepID=UPI0005C934FC|nr:phytanoyl-CoA dioxygenase family protein [Azospirillum sp. B4]